MWCGRCMFRIRLTACAWQGRPVCTALEQKALLLTLADSTIQHLPALSSPDLARPCRIAQEYVRLPAHFCLDSRTKLFKTPLATNYTSSSQAVGQYLFTVESDFTLIG